MIRSMMAALTAACMASLTPALADDGPLTSALSVFQVLETGTSPATFRPADTVAPGGILEYRLDYENVSQAPLADLVIQAVIPHNTEFIEVSQSVDRPAVFEAKVEGLEWSTLPVTRYEADENGVLQAVEIPAEEYVAVRWRVAEPLAAGESTRAVYRVRVDG